MHHLHCAIGTTIILDECFVQRPIQIPPCGPQKCICVHFLVLVQILYIYNTLYMENGISYMIYDKYDNYDILYKVYILQALLSLVSGIPFRW